MDTFLEISEQIKKEISEILMSAVNGTDKKYRYKEKYIRWGLVEKDIHKAIELNLTSDD